MKGLQIAKRILPKQSIIILCAAVSDFVPLEVVDHKIHTKEELHLSLTTAPKILGTMVDGKHLTASFKLETDPSKLDERMDMAIDKYDVDMVIGNVWGNKNWIKARYNPKSMGKQKDIEHS